MAGGMNLAAALNAMAGPQGGAPAGGVGPPPAMPDIAPPPAIAPGEAQPHIGAAPYDVAKDPGWHGLVHPDDHELRNFLNQLEPEQRQMLQQRMLQRKNAAPGPKPGTSMLITGQR